MSEAIPVGDDAANEPAPSPPARTRKAIPFEAQRDTEAERFCGAASLVMIYASLGITTTQEEIWPSISQVYGRPTHCARTHLLAANALERGLDAVAVKARVPWEMLQFVEAQGLLAILNHRAGPYSPAGHYSVLVEVRDEEVVLHDPQEQPNRVIPKSPFLSLWRPWGPFSEITGQVMVLIDAGGRPPIHTKCPVCRFPIPDHITCDNCEREIPLRPQGLLGCVEPGCRHSMAQWIYCPHCDHGISNILLFHKVHSEMQEPESD